MTPAAGTAGPTFNRLGEIRCKLGEGPLWDVDQQCLYFVDVFGKRLWRYTPATEVFDHWDFETRISSLALNQGGAIVALENGLHLFDFASQALLFVGDPTAGQDGILLNDGKADAAGRFIVGSVDATGGDGAAVYSVDVEGRITELDRGFGITNGPCWSEDGCTFYLADSMKKLIYAYDYDMASGDVANRRAFANLSAFEGIPDGATIDSRGHLWTAMCDGAKILCLDTRGEIEREIDCPTGFVSSVMFGGAALDRLFVTSIDAAILSEIGVAAGASHRFDDLGGALFALDGLDVRGRPEFKYGGRSNG